MRIFHRETADEKQAAADQKWAREHPYGEPGCTDYWIEAMKRAYAMGEPRAQGELEKLAAVTGPQPPREWTDFPDWFSNLWIHHIASWNHGDSQYAMPY